MHSVIANHVSEHTQMEVDMQHSQSAEAWKSILRQLKAGISCEEFQYSLYYKRYLCAVNFSSQ